MCVWRAFKNRWREAEAWAQAGVGSEDIVELKGLIERGRFKHPIMGIRRLSEDTLLIKVGFRAGPLFGAGVRLWVRRSADGWIVERKGGWKS